MQEYQIVPDIDSIAGIVTNAHGEPLLHASVILKAGDVVLNQVHTDLDGKFGMQVRRDSVRSDSALKLSVRCLGF